MCMAVFALVFVGSVLSEEHTNHGPKVPHETADGTHNTAYDHEAVLGMFVVCVYVYVSTGPT